MPFFSPTRKRQLTLFATITILVVVLSQAIGYWINTNLAINESWELNSFVYFTHVRNYGGVFGLFQGSGWLFALLSVGLLAGVSGYLAISKQAQFYEYLCFGFIVGGGLSNIIDRFVYGSVIDFIDIQHIPYWNYVFNTADVMIHVGIWPMLLLSLRASFEQDT